MVTLFITSITSVHLGFHKMDQDLLVFYELHHILSIYHTTGIEPLAT